MHHKLKTLSYSDWNRETQYIKKYMFKNVFKEINYRFNDFLTA